MSFLGPKIWNKLSSNKKTTATTVSFTNVLKKAILNKLQERAILIFFRQLIVFLLLYVFTFITLGRPSCTYKWFWIFFRLSLPSSIKKYFFLQACLLAEYFSM